ncbi:hypothetical protein [Agromyces marinus]|uniref:Sporulation protein YtfJ (Spore_YtfJ) n=1 Tax=Agromyces marinus TaxID=1389020 RepID=A0ABM8H5W2_9MICO|nr:hypothetical protein [Agromyces marinus]UIP58837.1 hypothetical protein DSM26151_17260 [Agromyces marinus]BDZ56217.1 hypothetical protein GCM10025870_32900 [Agromyces marinus]
MADFVLELADKVAGIGVRTSYAEKVEVGGTEVVPVALGAYGFGGGAGTDDTQGEGSGGGGGGWSVPLGAYVGRGGDVRFEPNVLGLVIVAIPLIAVTGKALRMVIRALKR